MAPLELPQKLQRTLGKRIDRASRHLRRLAYLQCEATTLDGEILFVCSVCGSNPSSVSDTALYGGAKRTVHLIVDLPLNVLELRRGSQSPCLTGSSSPGRP